MGKQEREAADRIRAEMSKEQLKETEAELKGWDQRFDPWAIFPVFGGYSSDFDECAIDVLTEILTGEKKRHDLGAEMFREMLCHLDLCDYGTSPRYCFATPEFKPLVSDLIEKWRRHSAIVWADPLEP